MACRWTSPQTHCWDTSVQMQCLLFYVCFMLTPADVPAARTAPAPALSKLSFLNFEPRPSTPPKPCPCRRQGVCALD